MRKESGLPHFASGYPFTTGTVKNTLYVLLLQNEILQNLDASIMEISSWIPVDHLLVKMPEE